MRYRVIILLVMVLFSCVVNAQEKPAIEMQADRIVIYPGRMELTGEESLLDVLMMYPDLMQGGFEDVLSGYTLQVDKVAMNGDNRVLCSQLKAKMISRIQIFDNAAVAYGTVGMGRVIDINMKRLDEGVHGFVAAQGATDAMVTPSAQLEYGSKKTDVFANASYTHQDKYEKRRDNEYFTFHMTNVFNKKNRLLTYITQQNLNTKADGGDKTQTQKQVAYAGYAHYPNDKGTKLVLFGGYQHQRSPKTSYPEGYSLKRTTDLNLFAGKVEFTTPLVKGMNILLGWLGCWSMYDYEQKKTVGADIQTMGTDYGCNYQDLYAQLNYSRGIWLFTLGDRVKFFHYGYDGMTHNDVRNNIQASIIAKPGRNHQFQVGYFRKFTNPAYSITSKMSEEEWMLMKGKLVERNIDEAKIAYMYSKKNFNLNVSSSYFGMENSNNVWRMHVSSYYRKGCFSVNAGINFYNVINDDDYATFNLSPQISLPCRWQISAQSIFYTKYASLVRDEQVYTALTVNKQLGKHWNLKAQWHDIFSSRYSALLGEVTYKF